MKYLAIAVTLLMAITLCGCAQFDKTENYEPLPDTIAIDGLTITLGETTLDDLLDAGYAINTVEEAGSYSAYGFFYHYVLQKERSLITVCGTGLSQMDIISVMLQYETMPPNCLYNGVAVDKIDSTMIEGWNSYPEEYRMLKKIEVINFHEYLQFKLNTDTNSFTFGWLFPGIDDSQLLQPA
ncbi:MAG: hypothetical protein ACK5LX_04195 [Oscillospiraceae bacterium]